LNLKEEEGSTVQARLPSFEIPTPASKSFVLRGQKLSAQAELSTLSQLIGNHPNLESIDLSWNNLDLTGVLQLMSSVCSVPHLTHLNFAANRLGEIKDNRIGRFGNNNNILQSDSTAYNNNYGFVSHLQKCANLIYLNLSNNCIGDSLVEHLVTLRLEVLDLSWNEIELQGAKVIGDSLPNWSLKELNLSWNHFDGAGAIEIVKYMDKNCTLKKLSLNGTKISDKDISDFVKYLALNNSIEHLELNCNMIASYDRISLLFVHPSLKSLDINNNPIQLSSVPLDSKVKIVLRENQQPDDTKQTTKI